MKAGLALFFLLVALLVQEQEARMGMMRGGGGGRRNRYNQYARRPWEAGYIGQYGSGRRYWDSDAWRRGGHQGGLSVYQEDDWRPPAWDEVPEMEPEVELEEEEEEECDWMCTQERMQELAREQERLQEERRVREQQRREEDRSPAGQREATDVADGHQVEEVPDLYPDWNWDSEGNRRMWEWRQRQRQEQEERREEMERKPAEDSSCTGMCRLMRMRTG